MDSGSDTGTDSDSDSSSDSDSDSDTGEPPPERCPSSEGWAYVSAGIRLACGVHTDGCAECWGLEGLATNNETGIGAYTRTGEDLPPDDQFASVSVVLSYGADYLMGNHACGLRVDGSVTCWGRNDLGQADAPTGTFSMVDVFDRGTCGLRTEGSIVCWGDPEDPAPAGKWREISVGWPIGVALINGGDATAWRTSAVGMSTLPETKPGSFISIAAGDMLACAIETDGRLFCWVPGYPEYDKELARLTPQGTYGAVCAGWAYACGLNLGGRVACFGDRAASGSLDAVPDATFTQISCGSDFACGITTEQGILCWGENDYGQATPPT